MNIQWLGQASFKLVESTGTTIVTDPFSKKEVGYDIQSMSADVVTKSNCDIKVPCSIFGNAQIINSDGVFEIQGVHILSIGDQNTATTSGSYSNLIFKFRMDGVDICHLGHIKSQCSVELSEALGSVDILLVPVGGGDTIDADMAREYIDLLMPDVVIPMSFKTRNCNLDIDKVDVFLRKLDGYEIIYTNKPIEFDRSEFDGETTKIIVFNK